jgi:hypothetical protein
MELSRQFGVSHLTVRQAKAEHIEVALLAQKMYDVIKTFRLQPVEESLAQFKCPMGYPLVERRKK